MATGTRIRHHDPDAQRYNSGRGHRRGNAAFNRRGDDGHRLPAGYVLPAAQPLKVAKDDAETVVSIAGANCILIRHLRRDGGTQSRVALNTTTIAEYAEAMIDGDNFPHVIVYYDGTHYWLADGFHRVAAAEKAGLLRVPADIRQGTLRDALLHSVGANGTHGLRRTNEDKRQAVDLLLRDDEWAQWSDRKIAEACAVAASFVGDRRRSICSPTTDSARKVTRIKDGKEQTYTITVPAAAPAKIDPVIVVGSKPEAPDYSPRGQIAPLRPAPAPPVPPPPVVVQTWTDAESPLGDVPGVRSLLAEWCADDEADVPAGEPARHSAPVEGTADVVRLDAQVVSLTTNASGRGVHLLVEHGVELGALERVLAEGAQRVTCVFVVHGAALPTEVTHAQA